MAAHTPADAVPPPVAPGFFGTGIAIKLAFHLYHGDSIRAMWKPDVDIVPEGDTTAIVVVRQAAVFTIWLSLRRTIMEAAEGRDTVVVDLSHTKFVDHSVMEKLHELEAEFKDGGRSLRVIGLENHVPLSAHPLAASRGAPLA